MGRFDGWTEESALDLKMKKQAKHGKYRNQKVEVDGICFDSKGEARHYALLKTARDAGALTFERQVPFKFKVTYRGENGKEAKRKMEYRADFVVKFTDGRIEVQDFKGAKTREYLQKKRLMRDVYGVEIREIKANW